MPDMSDATVYEYPDEVIVEVIGSDEFGEIAAITYQFSYVDGSGQAVAAKHSIDDAHDEVAEAALTERGYRLAVRDS